MPRTLLNEVVPEIVYRRMKGGSQSNLVSASDGNFYILKLNGNPQGPNTAFNEAFGTLLAEYLGLPVPQWRPVRVDYEFIQDNPGLSFEGENGVQAPLPGLHFGSSFVLGSPEEELYEVVPAKWMDRIENPNIFIGMLLLDIWAENMDRRQALFIEHSATRTLKAIFFDHGHMFGGPHGNQRLRSPRACLYSHRNIYKTGFESGYTANWLLRIEATNEIILKKIMERVPGEWRSPELQRNTIALLMENQQSLREKLKEIAGEFLN